MILNILKKKISFSTLMIQTNKLNLIREVFKTKGI